jgi:ribonucleoside-diphosphate reductase alpha chain
MNNSELPTEYQNFIHLSRYSRWIEEEGRRETWNETIARYFDFFEEHLQDNNNYKVTKNDRKELEEAILNQEVMPSMRSLMTAGDALKRDNVAGYNCAYCTAGRVRSFDEMVYILMCGTGMGFSVERGYLPKLPTISEDFEKSDTTIVIQDSKIGWAKSYKELTSLLIGGQIPQWDMSKIRPAGERLKTFGGRASGPGPLEDLFNFTVNIYQNAKGRKLTSIECHDIFCKIAEIVVVGGVRRSALISLSSLTDERMRDAKTGQWWYENGQRSLANNSVAYKCKPEMGTFMEEWLSLYKSKSGERGIFNREAAQKTVAKLGERRDANYEFGVNPCSEIILRDRQFCNLSEVVIRKEDTIETLKEKVRLATILGTWQCTLTNFRYLSSEWKKNCEEERLLGVSLTGIMDNDLTNGNKGEKKLVEALEELRQIAIDTNKVWAKKFKINESAAITCVKPSGTVSQLVDASSGIHARHANYYIRTVRADIKDPLCQFMQEKGFPCEPDVTKPEHTMVFSFPIKSPASSIFRNDKTAIEQLEHWLIYQRYWCEHKPSVTISVREDEWFEVGAWVYKYFDEISGVSFLPHSEHIYRQPPYQDCTSREYKSLLKKMPKGIDWSELSDTEKEDNTTGTQELACSAASCELVDITN